MKKLFSIVLVTLLVLAGTALTQTFSLKYTFQKQTPVAFDEFGTAVAVIGSNILVGAPKDDAGAGDAGAAYLFDSQTGNQIVLPNPLQGTTPGEFFGFAVAGVGNNFLIGAYGFNGSIGRFYLLDGTTGAPLFPPVQNPSPNASDQFGLAVAAVGNNILIGAPGDDTGASNAGAAYLFDGTTGNQLSPPSPLLSTIPSELFGQAVAGVGNNIFIGAPGFNISSGRVYLLDGTTGGLLLGGPIENPSPALADFFGASVTGVGNNLLVGAPFDDFGASNAGVAYLFDGTTGTQLLMLHSTTPGERFGTAVAGVGNYLLISAPGFNSNSGRAYLFDGTTGAPIDTIYNPTPENNDLFGQTVAATGSNIIIGAPGDNDAGASKAGAAYLFSSNAPPVADAGPDQTVECMSPVGTSVTLDGSGSSDPDGNELTYTWRENGNIIAGPTTDNTAEVSLTLGSYTIELTVDDGNGGTDTDEVDIDVVDTTPPVITLQPEITLWPPNHKYVTIDLSQVVAAVNDDCEGSIAVSNVKIISVSSDEPEDAPDGTCTIDDPLHVCYNGDGSTTDDIVIADDCQSVDLRRERAASGNGRVYSINVEVGDASGNVAVDSFKVSVPRDQGSGSVAMEDAPNYTVDSNCAGAAAKVAGNGERETDALINEQSLPEGFAVFQNYPNPFNPETEIRFDLPEASPIVVKIFNTLGEEIRTLADGDFAAGSHAVRWNALNDRGEKVPSGIYLYKLVTANFTVAKRMVLAK